MDEVLGLCFLSVPTWCPFRAQFYFNGHNWLASKLKAAGLSFEQQDNALVRISDWQQAQDLSDSLLVSELHARMDAAVARYIPDRASLGRYHWSIVQAEYATDIIFRSASDLAPLYDHLLRTACTSGRRRALGSEEADDANDITSCKRCDAVTLAIIVGSSAAGPSRAAPASAKLRGASRGTIGHGSHHLARHDRMARKPVPMAQQRDVSLHLTPCLSIDLEFPENVGDGSAHHE
jgi:hypothetical protein